MTINIDNKIISSIDFSESETAWKIEEAIWVIKYLKNNNKIILGGDILTENLEHTYDNWYYNIEIVQDFQFNVENSFEVAYKYILNYMLLNGKSYYVIFVTR